MRLVVVHLSISRVLRVASAALAMATLQIFYVRPARAAQGFPVAASDSVAKVVVTSDERSQAEAVFKDKCATCHGDEGRGDGPAASNLKPRPIDFHSHNWQKSVSDNSITKAIVFGGRSVGLSGQMAPNPDLENEPGIVEALVEKIRQWGK
jgi:cytochrome c553